MSATEEPIIHSVFPVVQSYSVRKKKTIQIGHETCLNTIMSSNVFNLVAYNFSCTENVIHLNILYNVDTFCLKHRVV